MKMPDELSPQARLLLERYRASDTMTPSETQRLLDTVLTRAARGDVPAFDTHIDDIMTARPATTPRGASRLWASPLAKAAVFLGATGVAAAAFVGARTRLAGPTAHAPLSGTVEPPTVVVAPQPKPTLDPPLAEPPPASKPSAVRANPARRSAASPTTAEPSRARTVSDDATIDAEVRLIGEAQAAQNAGNPRRALQLLDEHATRFPSGKLADARVVARMIALCSSGQRAAAREEARRFLQSYPKSPFSGRVKNICAQDGEDTARP